MRLIDADAACATIDDTLDIGVNEALVPLGIIKALVREMLRNPGMTPTIDAVQVVRCKDCLFWRECKDTPEDEAQVGTCDVLDGLWDASDFCGDGKQRD